jgi:hypothetical protein
VIFLVFSNGASDPICVAKIARLPGDNAGLDREVANLRAAQATWAAGSDSIPRVIAYEDYADTRILIKSALVGRPMDPAFVRRQPASCVEAVFEWLMNFHLATRGRGGDGKGWLTRVVEDPLARLASVSALFSEEKALIDQTRQLAVPLRAEPGPSVFEHGDLSSPNILVSRAGAVRVLDWELAEPRGLPAVDLFFFLTYVAFACQGAKALEDYLAAFHDAFFGSAAWARPHVAAYAEKLQLSSQVVRSLFVMCWSRYVANLLTRLNGLSTDSEGAPDKETVAWLKQNRYFALWKYAVQHADDLKLVN